MWVRGLFKIFLLRKALSIFGKPSVGDRGSLCSEPPTPVYRNTGIGSGVQV